MTLEDDLHLDATPDTVSPFATARDGVEDSPRQSALTSNDTLKPVKRKAPKRSGRACVACRARKVRCDVLDGAPCSNCRWDEVDCVVLESRRWKKTRTLDGPVGARAQGHGGLRRDDVGSQDSRRQTTLQQPQPRVSGAFILPNPEPRNRKSPEPLQEPDPRTPRLPAFIKPLSSRIAPDDVQYLRGKGALTLPSIPLQRALLRAFIEFVHPCLPLLDLPEFLGMVGRTENSYGIPQLSLLLYQAVMFSGTAFVDMKFLRDAGFSSRRSARRCFFQRTKLLHDLDCESDRLTVVQALLLMSYWHDNPDDQRDMWHWIGAAVSLAYTIGLNRNPATTGMPARKQRLWKRVWWSCFIRDRLISLGLRRPTHITDENYDIPMLTEADFEIEAIFVPEETTAIAPTECILLRNTPIQLELAAISVAMAKLCICVGSMTRVRDSTLARDRDYAADGIPLSTDRKLHTLQRVAAVDFELMAWVEALPGSCRYQSPTQFQIRNGGSAIAVQRAMLHMIYHATISALHRTPFHESSSRAPQQARNTSRLRVHNATMQITRIASELYNLHLEKYLPTTGVTVILPAMIVQLLELKSPVLQSRERAARGFRQCMRVIKSLRETHAAAEHAAALFETSLSSSGIDVNAMAGGGIALTQQALDPAHGVLTPPPENAPYMTSYEALFSPKPTQYESLQAMQPVPRSTKAPALKSFTPGADAAATSEAVGGRLDQTVGGATPKDSPDCVGTLRHGEDLANPAGFDWCDTGMIDFDLDQWLNSPLHNITLNWGFGTNNFGELGGGGGMDWSTSTE